MTSFDVKIIIGFGHFLCFAFKSSSTFIPTLCSAVLRWMPAGVARRAWLCERCWSWLWGDVVWLISHFLHSVRKLSQTQFTIWYSRGKTNNTLLFSHQKKKRKNYLHIVMPTIQPWRSHITGVLLRFTGHISWKSCWLGIPTYTSPFIREGLKASHPQ